MKRFLQNEDGNFVMVGALLTVPIIMALGMSVDYSRMLNAKNEAQIGVDSAALAAAREPSMSDEEVRALAKSFVMSNVIGNDDVDSESITVTRSADGAVTVSLDTELPTEFMQVAGYPSMSINVSAVAAMDGDPSTITGNDSGCVYLTDPRNTGLKMEDDSRFSTNCAIMINTRGKAIDISDDAQAEFESICAQGSISATPGSLTPQQKDNDCDFVLDPFEGMAQPAELSAACSTSAKLNVNNNDDISLSPGVHCGAVTVNNKGTLELEPGTHYFKGGLDIHNGGTLTGDDVLVALNKGVYKYNISGTLDISGRKTGDYAGFVIYNEDFKGNSNRIIVGKKASFNAEGLIYLPNTSMLLDTSINEHASQSILVADRFELSGDAAFHARIDATSEVPIPSNIGGGSAAGGAVRLID